MKVIVYNSFWKLNNCIKIIGVFKNINSNLDRNAMLFIKNGKAHNETSYAYYNQVFLRYKFAYKGIYYYDIKSKKSWKKQIKELKRQEKLKVFK